jgi:hypothetical protein
MFSIDHDVVTYQVQGLKLLTEVLNRCGSVKEFLELYLQDKDNLEMVMTKMLDENKDVKEAAFELLIIYLFTPKDMKSDEVNDCLALNCDRLISIIEGDLEHTQDETQAKQKKEAIDWLNRIQLRL